MKRLALLISCLLLVVDVFCQPRFPVAGKYKREPAQGMAVYGSAAFLLNNTGLCRVVDLKTGEVSSEFSLGSVGVNNHANSASFGIERVGRNKYPVMYVSECNDPCRCFVENVTDSGAVLVQTIALDREGIDSIARDWVVDRRGKTIYTISRRTYSSGKEWTCAHRINQYRLPRLGEGEYVVLSQKDVLNSYDILFPNVLQGAAIKKNFMYLPVGLEDNKIHYNRKDKERALIVVNLKTCKVERKIDLMDITKNEPEDCDFYKGKLLLYCGQSGGIYEIPYK